MKKVGQTNNGVLIEMSDEELREFELLVEATEGCKPWGMLYPQNLFKEDHDLKSAFGCIRAWFAAKFAVNVLQANVNELNRALGCGTATEATCSKCAGTGKVWSDLQNQTISCGCKRST